MNDFDRKAINTIRMLAVDAIQKANSGHPGLPMGAAPMAYVLWTRFLKHNPRDPKWADRDRFVLSAGHGSMLLYALLYLTGYDVTLDDLKQFRQWGSITPGHPEAGLTPGVEISVPRFQCRNLLCKRFKRTFSIKPYPVMRSTGITILFLLQLLTTLKGFSWLKLSQKTGYCYSILRRWKKRANLLHEWLKSRQILDEPGMTWQLLQHHYSIQFYPYSLRL